MPGYYKVAIVQSYFAQALVNVLYYGDAGGNPFATYSVAQAAEVGTAVAARFTAQLAASWPTGWTLGFANVSFVDNRGDVDPSTSEISVAVGTVGASSDGSDGQWNCAILAFKGVVAPGAARLVKRSYIAVGPMLSASVGAAGGAQGAQLAALVNLANDLELPVTTATFGQAFPVRIGRTVAPEPIAVTSVNLCIPRPNVSVRKSRKPRPTG
jgi:hypothetical protein